MDPLLLLVFTRIASTEGFIAIATIVLVYLITKRKVSAAIALVVSTLGLILSTMSIKELLRVPRPDSVLIEVTGYAFPSGHATGVMFLALLVAYLGRTLQKPYRYFLYTASAFTVISIGLSRIYFGAHTPLQVFAGFVLGAFWAGVFVVLSRRKHS